MMDIGLLLTLALVLVCPLTMFWMMRGHGKAGKPDLDGDTAAGGEHSGHEEGRTEPLARHHPPRT
jgi:hypothetical protein